MEPTPFKVFPQFNQPELAALANTKARVDRRCLPAFQGPGIANRIVRELAETRAIHLKEVLESFEFHRRTRKRIRGSNVADLCCGHGFTGLLFATEKQVEQVTLIDQRRTKSFDVALACVVKVMPEVRDKIRYIEANINEAASHLEEGTHCIAVHACGEATDLCIDTALAVNGRIAVMGCCYSKMGRNIPPALRKGLGIHLAVDVERTHRLHSAGYQVDWSAIPEAITPMNRILIAWKPPGYKP